LENNVASTVTAESVKEMVGSVTGFAVELEKLAGAAGVGGFDAPQVEQLTLLLGNLAGVAIQAVHDVAGKAITPESVLALAPTVSPLKEPVG